MELQISNIKPGILVTEHISLTGGIHYCREFIDSRREDQTLVREWHTIAHTDNVDERKEAQKIASRVYASLRRVCAQTPVGLICPASSGQELAETLTEMRGLIDVFNSTAKTCRILAYHACFEVASTNHTALQAVLDRVAEIATNVDGAITMEDSKAIERVPKRFLRGVTPTAYAALSQEQKDALLARVRAELIRSAIAEARGLDTLLPDEAGTELRQVIQEARRAARKICNRVERRGDSLDEVISEVDLTGIRKTRAAFVAAAVRAKHASQPSSDNPGLGQDPGETLQDREDPSRGNRDTGSYLPAARLPTEASIPLPNC
jgi:hypothetical protein